MEERKEYDQNIVYKKNLERGEGRKERVGRAGEKGWGEKGSRGGATLA